MNVSRITWLLAATFTAPSGSIAAETKDVLSAYHGAYIVPTAANPLCPAAGPSGGVAGLGGMPVVFAEPLQPTRPGAAFDPNVFSVTVGGERVVMPVCATLLPAIDPGERSTVALFGDFGLGGDDIPTSVDVVGPLTTVSGRFLQGVSVDAVSPIDAPPGLLRAEAFDPANGVVRTSSLGDGTQGTYCPAARTTLVVKLTFSGGVSGEDGRKLGKQAAEAVLLTIIDGAGQRTVIHPFAIRDQDNDNHLDLCFGDDAEGATPVSVGVFSNTLYGPYNVPNPAGAVTVEQAGD